MAFVVHFLIDYFNVIHNSNEQDLQRIFDSIIGCIREYGMKVSEKKNESDLYTWSEEGETVEFLRK